MINLKKLTVLALLGVTIIGGGTSIATKAYSDWDYGLYNGHNGYYMAYSYYHDSERSHYSWAELDGSSSGNQWAPADYTSQANSPSKQSTSWDAGYGY